MFNDMLYTQFPCNNYGLIIAGIIYQYHFIYNVKGYLLICLLKSLFGIICRENYYYLFVVKHNLVRKSELYSDIQFDKCKVKSLIINFSIGISILI